MKNFIQNHNLVELGLALIAFTIPFWELFNNIAVAFTLLTSILYFKKNKFWKKRMSTVSILFVIIFLLMSISLLYSEDLNQGLKKIEQRSLFIVIPVIIHLSRPFLNNFNNIKKILQSFLLATLLGCIVCLCFAMYRTYYYASLNPFNEINGNFFSYFELTSVLNIHPIYFGTYVIFSIIIILETFYSETKVVHLPAYLKLLILIIQVLFTFLLNSFILVIILLILLSFSICKYLIRTGNRKVAIIVFMCSILPLYHGSYFVREKLKGIQIFEDLTNRDFTGKDFTALRARVAKAKGSINLIKENFWLGVGVGDEKTELLRVYKTINFQHGVEQKFNSHNQFLTEFIYTGFFGFLTLIILFVVIFRKAIIKKDFLLFSIGLIYLLFCLTESSLVRNKGIIFFIYFSTLLSQSDYRFKSKNVSLNE